MKEVYEKPGFRLELFELTQNIAMDCNIPHEGTIFGKHFFMDPESCYWGDHEGIVRAWLPTNELCEFPVEAHADFNGMCYNNPEGMLNVFGS